MNLCSNDPPGPGQGVQSQGQIWSGAEPSWLVTLIILASPVAPAQEALRNSMAGAVPAVAGELRPESLPYTLKTGDFRVLVTPSLQLDWNSNVTLSKTNTLQDFILRPLVELDGSYPIGQRNLLRFDVGIGYDQYLEQTEFSALRLLSGSELAFDAEVKDFRFNVHDRFQYIQDPAEQPSVAATGRYGGLDNTAGMSGAWDLRDVVLTLGYDHQSFVAISSDFDHLNHRSELFVARVGFRPHPTISVGVESGESLTAYRRDFLNDNQGYSGGVFADWNPGTSFRVQASGGYCGYSLDKQAQVIQAMNGETVYVTLTVTHSISDAVNYRLRAGHELRLGTSADLIEDSYVRPSIKWEIIKHLSFTSYLGYEHGRQGPATQTGGLSETYDWLGGGLIFSHPITKRLVAGLSYRLTLRASDEADREYAQHLLGLRLTYGIQ